MGCNNNSTCKNTNMPQVRMLQSFCSLTPTTVIVCLLSYLIQVLNKSWLSELSAHNFAYTPFLSASVDNANKFGNVPLLFVWKQKRGFASWVNCCVASQRHQSKKKKERKKKKIYSYNNARLQGLSRKTVFKKQQRAKLLEKTFHC